VPLAKTIVHTGEATVKPAKSSAMEATKSAAAKPAAVKPAAMKPAAMETPAPAMKPSASAMETSAPAMETPAPAMSSVGEIWLTESGCAQQSSCDCQDPSVLRGGLMFV